MITRCRYFSPNSSWEIKKALALKSGATSIGHLSISNGIGSSSDKNESGTVSFQVKLRFPDCDYLFHIEGKPLNYCTIQSNYRSAQVRTGVPYSGTHCLRHGMATLARKVGGMGLDSVVAMTGHKDLKLAAHYSKIDGEVQKETSLKILDHIKQLGYAEEAKVKQEVAQISELNLGENVVQFRRVK